MRSQRLLAPATPKAEPPPLAVRPNFSSTGRPVDPVGPYASPWPIVGIDRLNVAQIMATAEVTSAAGTGTLAPAKVRTRRSCSDGAPDHRTCAFPPRSSRAGATLGARRARRAAGRRALPRPLLRSTARPPRGDAPRA